VKPPEGGGEARGDDGGTNIQGRKRPGLGETRGLRLAVLMTSAHVDGGFSHIGDVQSEETLIVVRQDCVTEPC
jgi:hypothetical protein